jgi:putative ABC transport system permease protein
MFGSFLHPLELTVPAVLTLGLGIGSQASIFAVVKTVLLKPLSTYQSERLVDIVGEDQSTKRPTLLSPNAVEQLASDSRILESVAAYNGATFVMTGFGDPISIAGISSSPNLFRLLGIQPVRGREASLEETRAESVTGSACLISSRLWCASFACSPSIIGKTVRLNDRAFSVVGIFDDRDLNLPYIVRRPQVWVPLGEDPVVAQLRSIFGQRWLQIGHLRVLGRLRYGVTRDMAETIANSTLPSAIQGTQIRIQITSLLQDLRNPNSSDLLLFIGAGTLLLIIAFANTAYLQLTRATSRTHEMAIRLALGAGKIRLFWTFARESIQLGILGGLAGTLFAYLCLLLIQQLEPDGIFGHYEIGFDLITVMYAMSIAFVLGTCLALISFYYLPDVRLNDVINTTDRTTRQNATGRRSRQVLLITQLSSSFLLLSVSVLFTKSLFALHLIPLGFDPRNVIVADITVPQGQAIYKERWRPFTQELLANLKKTMASDKVALALAVPGEHTLRTSYEVLGASMNVNRIADFQAITPHYFETLQLPLISGRDFVASDGWERPKVCIVSEAVVKGDFPRQAVGQRIVLNGIGACEIVGIVGDVTIPGDAFADRSTIYIPLAQLPTNRFTFFLAAVVKGPFSGRLVRNISNTIHTVDSGLPLTIAPIETIVARGIATYRVRTIVAVLFAGVSLFLLTTGVASVLSYSVSQRTLEIGVRIALGSTQRQIYYMVVRETLLSAGIGLLLGLVFAPGFMRLTKSLVFGVASTDMSTYIIVGIILLAVSVGATAPPAHRAASLDPAAALREH